MKIKLMGIVVFLIFTGLLISCNKKENTGDNNSAGTKDQKLTSNYKIEFVELGSVSCIPCKKMQPVMASVEKKYAGQVRVTFHDVWKDEAPAKKYGIDLIPTQVFLDANGKELMRHQGFFPEEEIDKFLQSQGVNISQ